MHLEHVNMTVANVARSIDFYTRLLGLKVRWQGESNGGRPAAHIGSDDFYIALFEAEEPSKADGNYDRVGLNHFGFVVDDLDAAKARAIELGASIHLEGDYDPGRRAYLYDPDGIEVELVEYAVAGASR